MGYWPKQSPDDVSDPIITPVEYLVILIVDRMLGGMRLASDAWRELCAAVRALLEWPGDMEVYP